MEWNGCCGAQRPFESLLCAVLLLRRIGPAEQQRITQTPVRHPTTRLLTPTRRAVLAVGGPASHSERYQHCSRCCCCCCWLRLAAQAAASASTTLTHNTCSHSHTTYLTSQHTTRCSTVTHTRPIHFIPRPSTAPLTAADLRLHCRRQPAMTTASPAPRRPLLLPAPPSTASSKLTIPSVRLSLCVPPSTAAVNAAATAASAAASSTAATNAASPSAPHPTSASSTAVLQSFMAKRSHGRFWQARREWKLRWVVLDRPAQQLRIYDDSECLRRPELKPRRAYSTAGMECLPKGNENGPADDFDGRARWSFDLILKQAGKKMELGCPTAEQRAEWMAAIAAVTRDEADKENNRAADNKQNGKANTKQQQRAASPTAACVASSPLPAASVLSPPRPPKRPLMGAPFAAPTIATPASTTATMEPHQQQADEGRPVPHERTDEEAKELLSTPPSAAEAGQRSAYLSKAIAAGTAIPLLPGRPQQAATEVPSAAKKPALPASAPNAAARPHPAQPPPAPPAKHHTASSAAANVAGDDDSSEMDGADDLSAHSSQSALAALLVSHHAALMESAAAEGSTAWNDEWQVSVSKARNASSSVSSVLHSKHVYELHRQFLAVSEKWARRIVEEYCLPGHMRTVKPVADGVEREKQVFLMEGIGFQLAQAGDEDEDDYLSHHSQSPQQQHGDDGSAPEMSVSAARLADQLGSKKATHELHTLSALHAANLPSLVCLPLMATVDYLGFRVKATATLPIYDESALVWGRDSRGQHKHIPPATDVLNELAAALNIRPHSVDGQLVPLSSSVRVYRSGERFYVTELNSVAPVDVDVQYAMAHGRLQQGWPAKVFRHEYLLHCTQPLQSDVYADTDRRMKDRRGRPLRGEGNGNVAEDDDDDDDDSDADEEEAEARAAEASRTLQHTMIPRFIKAHEYTAGGQIADIPAVPHSVLTQPPPAAQSTPGIASAGPAVTVWPCVGGSWLDVLVDGSDLCRAMHAHGINLRYLGRVAEASRQAHLRQLSAVEMVARTVKALLSQNLRTVHRKVVSTEAARQQTAETALAPHSLLLLQHSLLERHREGVVELMNLALGRGEDSDQFWTLLLYPDIRIKYALTADSPVTLGFLRQLHLPSLFTALQQRCGVCFVDREYAFGSERPIASDDFVAFAAHVKHAQPVLAADRHNSKARRACSSQPVDTVEPRDWQRLCTAIDMQLTIRGWRPADSQQQHQQQQSNRVELNEARLRLRLYNELINAQLQCGNVDKADATISAAQQLASQLSYPCGFSSLPLDASGAGVPPPLTSFGSHAENGRLQINRMWSGIVRLSQQSQQAMAAADSGSGGGSSGLADIRRSLTEQYQSGVSMLNYHVGLLHPLMLALHFALATFHMQRPSEAAQATDGQVAVNLLTHCHQFARALFGSAKPLTWQLALTLSRLLAEQREYEGAVRWLNTAADGMKKAAEADKRSKGAEAEEERQKLKDRRAAVMADIAQLNDRQQRESEEKTQLQ